MGIGMIIGGALQGLGSGIATKGQMDITERREMALQNLRAQQAADQARLTGDINDRNDLNSRKRDFYFDTERDKIQADEQRKTDAARGDLQIKRDEVKHGYDVEIQKLRTQGALTLEEARSRNNISELDHKDALDAARSDRTIRQVVVLPNGQMMGITETGETKALQGVDRRTGKRRDLIGTPKSNEDDMPIGIGQRARQSGQRSPAPAASPASRPAARASVMDGDPAERSSPPPRPGGPDDVLADVAERMYTREDLAETARRNGMTIEQARRWLDARGFVLAE